MSIDRITVIGAGTMGHGIAAQAARFGYDVVLNDIDDAKVKAGYAAIQRVYKKALAKEKMTPDEIERANSHLRVNADFETAVADADLVIEAVPESIELKRKIFADLSRYAGVDAILATNTSSLPVTEVAAACSHPEQVVGMHFFNPVAVMPLLELVRGEYTDDKVLAEVRAVGDAMGKTCIEVQDSPGFATSRLGIALGNEAMRMFEEGVATAEDIDKAMTLGYRHPIGPLALTDLVGLDVRLAISEHLFREIGADTFRPPRILRRMVRAGKLGRKSGEGFYKYD